MPVSVSFFPRSGPGVIALMKQRFRMYCRQAGLFYVFDRGTGKRESLETDDKTTSSDPGGQR
jgi:hypothetical protein